MVEFSPLSHAIALVLLGWLWWALGNVADGPLFRRGRNVVVAPLVAWVFASSWIAWQGWYLAYNASHLLILFGTAMPFVLLGAMFTLPSSRALLVRFVDETPPQRMVGIHVLRVLGLGTVYRWWMGEIPGHFEIPVGIPDFLIGLTALWVARQITLDTSGTRRLSMVWNLLGAAILLQAPIWMQLSQPGPLQIFYDGPRTDDVLAFPMAIVPTFVAPFFIAVHLAALAQLRRRSAGSSITT